MLIWYSNQSPHGFYVPRERLLPRRLVSFADPVARKACLYFIEKRRPRRRRRRPKTRKERTP